MKWLVFNTLGDKLLPFGYNASIRIAYTLNINVVSATIGKSIYLLEENSKKFTFESKMRFLLDISKSSPDFELYKKGIDTVKVLTKIKNKNSQIIVSINQMKSSLLTFYEAESEQIFDAFEQQYGIRTLGKLLNDDHFYYYNYGIENDLKIDPEVLKNTEFLQLLLPDPEKGMPLFFISFQDIEKKEILPFIFHKSESLKAEKQDAFYADDSCVFPYINTFTDIELSIARTQLKEPAREFREKIEQWAQVCYDNPNSNKGLEFFRKNIKNWLPSTKDLPLKSAVVKNSASTSFNQLQSQLLIGEAPIEKIWELYLQSKTINQETYDALIIAKKEQAPKFDGRWPVIIFKCIDENVDFIIKPETTSEPEVVSIRKTISLD
ncbi:MAG: hypothetical protein H7239_14040 [Flavobacterium sp.]|nr:hypothetical protein [Flavobacterium sp.]